MRRQSYAGQGILRADTNDTTWPPAHAASSPDSTDVAGEPTETSEVIKPRPLGRKSLGRRVSFNPKAHIRPYVKDSQWQSSDESSMSVEGGGSLQRARGMELRSAGKKFELPDLSSVRRTSGQYDFSLSPGGPAHKSESSIESESTHDASYEEDLRAPAEDRNTSYESRATELSADMLEDSALDEQAPAAEETPSSPPRTPPSSQTKRMPRDSIAVFFDNPRKTTPQKRPFHEAMPADEDAESNADIEIVDAPRTITDSPALVPKPFSEEGEEWPGYPTVEAPAESPTKSPSVRPATPVRRNSEQPPHIAELSYDFNDDNSINISVEADASHDFGYLAMDTSSPARTARPLLFPSPHLSRRSRLAQVYDDTIAGFFPKGSPAKPASDAQGRIQPPTPRQGQPQHQREHETDDEGSSSSDEDSIAFPATYASRTKQADQFDDTIAGFFANPPYKAVSAEENSESDSLASSLEPRPQIPPSPALAPYEQVVSSPCLLPYEQVSLAPSSPQISAGRKFAMEDNDDTIGMFFKGGDATGNQDASGHGASNENEATRMDTISGVGRGSLKRPEHHDDDDTAQSEDMMSLGTPTQSAAERRRSSLRSSRQSPGSPSPATATPTSPQSARGGSPARKIARLDSPPPKSPARKVARLDSPPPKSPKRKTPAKSPKGKRSSTPTTQRFTPTEMVASPTPSVPDSAPAAERGTMDVDDAASLAGDNEAEDDLKNANLSMGDVSVMEESKPVRTVREFLQLTGIWFQDNVATTTGYRRDTNAYLPREETPHELDYHRAAVLWDTELEVVEFGCRELQQAIEGMRNEVARAEAEAEANPPPIFFDVCEGTVQEHAELSRQLKETRTYARTAAKEEWRAWRTGLMSSVEEYFGSIALEPLRSDEQRLRDCATRVDAMHAAAVEAVAATRKEITQVKQRLSDEDRRLAERREALQRKREEQAKMVAELQRECERVQELTAQEERKEKALQEEKVQLRMRIADAENLCKNLMVFDPEEMSSLRGEYKLLASMFPWTSERVEAGLHVLVYDNVVQVELGKAQDGECAVELRLAEEKSPLSTIGAPTEHPVIRDLGRDKIMQILMLEQERTTPCKGGRDFERVTTRVAALWNALRRFQSEVDLARETLVLEHVPFDETILDTDVSASPSLPSPSLPAPSTLSSSSSLPPAEQNFHRLTPRSPVRATATFFSRARRTRFTVTVGIPTDSDGGQALDPWSPWTWNVDVEYGDVDVARVLRVCADVGGGDGKSGALAEILARVERVGA
ncbi:hypothetical protein HDU89_006170 [Geranomyces variabilis]|nr:hypothetical protein HDU89_006170 [Geranomyces variabilis]